MATFKRPSQPPMQVSQKKMLLAYKDNVNKFLGYDLHFLVHPIVMVFKQPVRVFKVTTAMDNERIGVADIGKEDKTMLMKHLRDVSGSLTVTTKQVKSAFTEGKEGKGEALFMSFKANLTKLFNHKGGALELSQLPPVTKASFALIISGMKVKEDEASYMIRAHQIMLKKPEDEKCLFDVTDSTDEDETF